MNTDFWSESSFLWRQQRSRFNNGLLPFYSQGTCQWIKQNTFQIKLKYWASDDIHKYTTSRKKRQLHSCRTLFPWFDALWPVCVSAGASFGWSEFLTPEAEARIQASVQINPRSSTSGFPGGSDSKRICLQFRRLAFMPGSGRSAGERNSNPLQYSCLESPMDRGAWQATVHGVRRGLDTTEQLTLSLPLNLVWPSVIFLASLSLTSLTCKEAYLAGWLAHSQKVLQHDGSSQVALAVSCAFLLHPPASAGDIWDMGSIPGLGRSPGGGHGNPFQYSCLENSMDEVPGGLQSIGSQRVRHDWSDLACKHSPLIQALYNGDQPLQPTLRRVDMNVVLTNMEEE